MNDDQLESLLRAADRTAGKPAGPLAGLAWRARNAHAGRCRRATRIKYAVALAGGYLAGMVTIWIAFASGAGGTSGVAARPENDHHRPGASADILPEAVQGLPGASPRKSSPNKPAPRRLVAEKSRYELLRQMGDESQRRGDLQAAVAYYGQALDAATNAERKISYERDNWLLVSLKQDQLASQHMETQGDSI